MNEQPCSPAVLPYIAPPDITNKEDVITTENQTFIKEVIQDNFGPPGLIKGLNTYNQSSTILVKTNQIERQKWVPWTRRSGVIARKIGQYPLWLKSGEKIRTTLLQIVDNHVVKYTPPEEFFPTQRPTVRNFNNYGCLLVGAESIDPSILTKEYCGLFRESGVMPKRTIARFLVSPSAAILPGTPINVGHFRVGDFVDVRGKTVDHAFQGVIKRHGFKGMPASHGVTKTHRRPGNIGGGGEKGRVWPGTKMPGHMGNRWRKIKGLRVWRISTKYNVMWVQGSAVPGDVNSLVYIYDTILPLRQPHPTPPFPTQLEDDSIDGDEDIWHDNLHKFEDETITFQTDQ